MKSKWIISYLLFWLLLCLYSFSRLDLNLTLYSQKYISPIISNLQYLGYYQRSLATLVFIVLSLGLFSSYLYIIKHFKSLKLKDLVIIFSLITLTGIVSYPMFSYDIFNYLFNAKMVLVYGANPHLQTALQFSQDSWTRFMHNTHSPAPYGYGWTLISLIPVFLGLPKLTLSLWFTKILIITFFFLEIYAFYLIAKKQFKEKALSRTLLLALNPLIVVETFINGHNDSLMMSLALLATYFLVKKNKKKIILSYALLGLSVFMKIATIVLTPLFLFSKKLGSKFFEYSGILLVLILLSRPGQLNSWYLHWGISFLFLSKSIKLVKLALLLSIGGLLRYAPFIYFGNWDYPVTVWRWVLLLLPLIMLFFLPNLYVSKTEKN